MYKNIAYAVIFIIFGIIIFMAVTIKNAQPEKTKSSEPVASEEERIYQIFKDEL